MSSNADEQQKVAHVIKTALTVVAGSIGLVLAIVMLAQYAVGSYFGKSSKDDPALSSNAIAERLKAVGEVKVDANASALVAVAAPVAAATPVASGAKSDVGQTTYNAVCVACHSVGAAGAPKTGDQAAWSPRIAQGKDTLYASALKGKGAMLAKGGNPGLSDDAVKAAVDYLVAQVK